MTKIRVATFLTALLFASLALNVGAAAADEQSGTWKMNLGKSKYASGQPPRSATLKIESDGTVYKVDSQGVDASGNPTHTQFEAKVDGKDYPALGLPNGDHVSVKRTGPNTVEVTMKKGGQTVLTVTSVVSKDGKTRSSTFKGKDAQGNDISNVVVYDKE